ncbi:hypothetical protein CHLNCDRAFT_52409 [Chlorella variabilis]|uniref:DUF4460 domain-containing protein n=1 Tax=Chlorella variabilis TaxID=554065 RepID=E1ZF07_CHLVA|nr:hypothetical protein CHLNCDRAFT_52409 [Chlorella variabilis]EFN55586.1 hypothetical protein CHLNCDRAFT_52409 [Chlorella variabilis]|eukprot:XP_005847688.1 hypothetical protein CHLNCDRAFT_52409 [Chlorella variabilis]
MDPTTERKYVRQIVRQVHPDLFSAYPYERAKNSEALKALNVYADQLSQGLRPQAAKLTFFVRQESEDEALGQISAELPSYGSLGPLFFAFGLISEEELKQGAGAVSSADDRDLAAWLRETVDEAVRCDCPPSHLLDFLCSSAGLSANETAAQVAGSREEEEALLAAVREALGAKHDKVLSAARRLLDCAPAIRQAGVDLSGASLAIDDCYELWDSGGRRFVLCGVVLVAFSWGGLRVRAQTAGGFISIPHDFNLSDLQPKLQALLSSGAAASGASGANGAAAAAGAGGSGAYGTNSASGANGGGYGAFNGSGEGAATAPGEFYAGQFNGGPVRAAGGGRAPAAAAGASLCGRRLPLRQQGRGAGLQRRLAAAGPRARQPAAGLRLL